MESPAGLKERLVHVARRPDVDRATLIRELSSELEGIANGKGSPAAREVLELYLDRRVDLNDDARFFLGAFLSDRGYAVNPFQPPRGTVPQLVAYNVTEEDMLFERLCHSVGRPDAQVQIGVLDSGFDISHPAIESNVWTNPGEVAGSGRDDDGNGYADDVHGFSFSRGTGDIGLHHGLYHREVICHGTGTLGVAVGQTHRIRAVLAQAMAARASGPIEPDKPAEALDYLAAQGARVINISMGWYLAAHVAAVRAAMERHPDVLFVMSAGNDSGEVGIGKLAPESFSQATRLPNVMVVAAATLEGELEQSSNWSQHYVDVATPGTVMAPSPGDRFRPRKTTSFATPRVTNLCAKCLTLDPTLTPSELKGLIRDTVDADPRWTDRVAAGGIINPTRALNRVAERCRTAPRPELG